MENRNNTNVPDLILMGLTDSEEIQWVLIMLFLLIYLITVLGNAEMILIVHLDPQLHTPMYFFLSHLSFLDLSYSMVITPKTLENLLTSNKNISFMGCSTQMYFFVFLVITEFFFFSSMAYDLYVAICNPLNYPVIMSTRLCCVLIIGSYMIGFTESIIIVLFMNSLHFCKSNVTYHLFCELTPNLTLSCNDTSDSEIMLFILASLNVMVSVTTISAFYVSMLSTILKLNPLQESTKPSLFMLPTSWESSFLQHYNFYLFKTRVLLLGKGYSGLCVLYYGDPHLESTHLYLKKEVKNALRVMLKREGSRQLK